MLVCSRQRKQMLESNDQFGATGRHEKPVPKIVIHLNLIICLVAKYFDQKDLADDFL